MAGKGRVRIEGDQLIVESGGAIVLESGSRLDQQAGAAVERTSIERLVGNRAKVGTTAGFVVGAANNLPYMATMPAGVTAGTLVVPLDCLKVGDIITGFTVIAQLSSAGEAVTLDAALRSVRNGLPAPTDDAIASLTQISSIEDTAVESAKSGLGTVVDGEYTYYILLTGTTGASTTITLLGLSVTVTEA